MRFAKGINLDIPMGQCQVDFTEINDDMLEFKAESNFYPLIIKIERMHMDIEEEEEKLDKNSKNNICKSFIMNGW